MRVTGLVYSRSENSFFSACSLSLSRLFLFVLPDETQMRLTENNWGTEITLSIINCEKCNSSVLGGNAI